MKTSQQFYTEWTPESLMERKKEKHTQLELSYIRKIISKKDRILDLGCGFGRITIPLAKEGYNIEGIDITPVMIEKASGLAKKENIKVTFKVGDMKNLPYSDNTFNIIFCLWSAFMELPKENEQLKAIKEMLRILKPNGLSFIEIRKPGKPGTVKIFIVKEGDKDFYKRKGNVFTDLLDNIETMPLYLHNKTTLSKLMEKAKVKKYKISIENFGGRDRMIIKFWKNLK